MEEIPLTVMINPKLKIISNEDTDVQYEACASVPQITGKVKRYKSIFLEYYNEEGIKVQRIVRGYFARLVQHECDHLDGIVFLDKVQGGFATKAMLKKFKLKDEVELKKVD
jgi:peptide deformylase